MVNFIVVFMVIAINICIKSINVVNVEVVNGSQTVTYVKKYSEYFTLINYLTMIVLFLCVIITVIIIIVDNRKVVKRFDYLVGLFDNVGLTKINPDNSKLTEYDMQVINAWNCSIEEISQLNELREKYFKNMVHDLKTPVQLLKMNLEMLELEQADNEYVVALFEELDSLEKNINNYLLVEKITFFEKVNKERFSIENYLVHQVERYKKLEFDVIVKTDIEYIITDVKMFGRIIENVIDNAVKYGCENCVYIEINQNQMIFKNRVCDDNLGNIFSKQRQYSISGNGLGVEIINTYISLLGWKISSEQVDDIFVVTIEIN